MSGVARALSHPAGGDEALRRALLQRVADRLAYARALHEGTITLDGSCCWVHYEYPTPPHYGYRTERMVHSLCAWPGDTFSQYLKNRCPHWHHHTEVFLA